MKTFTFPSSRQGNPPYTTIIADDGKLLCNCKGWTNRRLNQPRHCTHTKQLAAGKSISVRGEFVYLATVLDGELIAPAPVARVDGPKDGKRQAVNAPPAPMLASAMTDPVSGAAFDRQFSTGWLMEEKIDGHRCTVVVSGGTVQGYSRPRAGAKAANVRELAPHIVAQLARFPDGIYDGELVAPSGKAWDVTVVGTRLVFVIFDVLACNGLDLTSAPYGERREALLDILGRMPDGQTAISTVESLAPSWAGVLAIWKRGGEGVILKRTSSTYRPGYRSPDWLKVKEAHAATLTIIGFEAGKSGPFSALVLRDGAGIETTVKTLGNRLLADVERAPKSYLGRRVVISYQEKTPAGTYRHGILDHFAGDGE